MRTGLRRCAMGAAICSLAIVGCGEPPWVAEIAGQHQPIVGGSTAEETAWAATVFLDNGCTGSLLHPRVVVYAGHCGNAAKFAWLGSELVVDVESRPPSVRATEDGSATKIAVRRCEMHPDAGIGTGADLAYCELAEPVDVEIVPPVSGCERDHVVEGAEVTLVGFGFDAPEAGSAGVKRMVVADIASISTEILIGTDTAGTCRGDSGGPAFMRLGEAKEWRQVAVLSSGYQGQCGVGFYTDLAPFVRWIEERTQRDLTPCFDEKGRWSPTSDCMQPSLDDAGVATTMREPSSSCGAPAELRPDDEPPSVQILDVTRETAGTLLVSVEAADTGWGLRAVRAELLDSDMQPLHAMEDELPPYEFKFVGAAVHDTMNTGDGYVRVTATDRANNVSEDLWTSEHPKRRSASCSVEARAGKASAGSPWCLLVLALAALRRWRRESEHLQHGLGRLCSRSVCFGQLARRRE